MKRKIYGKILQKLLSLYPKGLKGHRLKRLKKLAGLICGLLRKKRCSMSAVGSGLPQQISAYSKEKACKDFLDNAWNDYQTHYIPYMQHFLPLFIGHLNASSPIHIVIDGSQMGNDHVALMISMVYKHRSIPLAWIVKKGGKGHFTNQMHVELMEQFYRQLGGLLPNDRQVILLGDGEFDSIELQDFCKQVCWDYVCRTAFNTVMYEEGERFQPQLLALQQGADHLFIPNVDFTHQRYQNVNFLYWHDPKYENPIPLISNLDEVKQIMEAYDKRYAIECLFKDVKSTSFNIHKTRLQSALAISNLIMLAAFAFTLLLKLAIKYDSKQCRRLIHRDRPDRTVCSIFFFALELLDYFLEENINFNFHISKHNRTFP